MPLPPWKTEHGVDAVLSRWLASSIVKPCLCTDETLPGAGRRPTPPLPPSRAESSGPSARAESSASTPTRRARSRPRWRGGTWWSPRRPRAERASAFTCRSCRRSPRTRTRALSTFSRRRRWRGTRRPGFRELMAAAGVDAGAVVYDGDTPGRRAAGRARAGARRSSRTRTCCTRGSSPTTRRGRARCRTCATSWSTRSTRTAASSARTWRTSSGASCASPASTAPTRRILGATATIGNPREHAARLFGVARGRHRARRRERRAPRRAALLPLQPAGRQSGARDPRQLREAGRDARVRPRGARGCRRSSSASRATPSR